MSSDGAAPKKSRGAKVRLERGIARPVLDEHCGVERRVRGREKRNVVVQALVASRHNAEGTMGAEMCTRSLAAAWQAAMEYEPIYQELRRREATLPPHCASSADSSPGPGDVRRP